MNRKQQIERMTRRLISNIKWQIEEMGRTYEEAKAIAQQESTAGPAIWESIDNFFNS